MEIQNAKDKFENLWQAKIVRALDLTPLSVIEEVCCKIIVHVYDSCAQNTDRMKEDS